MPRPPGSKPLAPVALMGPPLRPPIQQSLRAKGAHTSYTFGAAAPDLLVPM